MFFSEYQADQHPILFRFLLRAVAHLGHSRLIYRLATILPGVASVFMIGLTARKLYRYQPLALIAAAAFGFSLTIIDLNIDIRDYSLALFFIITAFYFFIGYLSSDGGTSTDRTLLLFALFSSLAIATEYYSIFFLLACFLVLAVSLYTERFFLACGHHSAARQSLSLQLRFVAAHFRNRLPVRNSPQSACHAPIQCRGVLLEKRQLDSGFPGSEPRPGPELHVPDRSSLGHSCSCHVASRRGGLFRNFPEPQSEGHPLHSIAHLLALLLQMAALSLLGMYPFGGFPRQQSVIFPFSHLRAFFFSTGSVRPLLLVNGRQSCSSRPRCSFQFTSYIGGRDGQGIMATT